MTNYKVFSIPKNLIPNKITTPESWEKFDENCDRAKILLNNNTLDRILSFSKTKIIRSRYSDSTIHRVKYSLDNSDYTIDEHDDACRFTVIVYLKKSSEIKDEFWVGKNKITENLWSKNDTIYNCLIFWGNSPHHGKIYGSGKREILCFFSD